MTYISRQREYVLHRTRQVAAALGRNEARTERAADFI